MQRLFSTFPHGLPGIGLVLLRVSVALSPLLNAYGAREQLPGWALFGLLVLLATVCVGFLTPLSALLTVALRLASSVNLAAGTEAVLCISALALAMLGPGAYSIDAYRYGRRIVVLPPRDTHTVRLPRASRR